MNRQCRGEAETILRQLAINIIEVIHSRRDVLQNRIVEVPDISGATYEPASLTHVQPRPLAYRFIEELLLANRGARCNEMIDQFHAVEDQLIWGQAPGYGVDNVGQDFLDNYCHALLTGPDGPLRCAFPLGAFVLFGPNTLYEDHSHAPNEVYLALTGGGQWRVGHHDWRKLEAGETVFIPSETLHAIRTDRTPLLTFSFWLEPGDMQSIAI